jgi:hypothetical protein
MTEPDAAPPMSDDRDIWAAAARLVDRHGEEAPAVAEAQAEASLEIDDIIAHGRWLAVAACCSELLRSAPGSGESVH